MFLQDMEFAKAAFEEAAESGHPEAQMGIGFLYATGNYFLLFTSRLDLKYGTFKTFYIKFWVQSIESLSKISPI